MKKLPFDVLVFHGTFQVCCVCCCFVWFKQMYTLKAVLLITQYTHSCTIHEMYDYDWGKLVICLNIDHIIDTSTWRKKDQYYQYTVLKISPIRKQNPSVSSFSALICIYGGCWLRNLVFGDKLCSEAQYDNL